ncbi:MAG TPA: SsrA-binding protein SmpB [Candidatus Dormibacteraeota bacterium]|nr:SsrA-binding protein SmpB [Candidatus Dormibacteraeota bacterium]
MAKKKTTKEHVISNRRARHDYELEDSLIVGLQLSGAETKALRMGHGHLRGAYVTVKENELWLINATIAGSSGIYIADSETTRARKLLAKKREIKELIATKKQGRTIVPLEILNRGRFIKLRIAVGKGRKLYDKRQLLKKRDEERRISASLKNQD